MSASSSTAAARPAVLWRHAVAHALAGAAAGSIALTLLFPLDQLRIRRQYEAAAAETARRRGSLLELAAEVIREEGVAGLYRGLPSTVVAMLTANFAYFFYYNGLKAGRTLRGGAELLTPALAGVLNVLTVNPFFVLSARIRTSTDPEQFLGGLDCLRQLLQREGPAALWSGVVPSLWLVTNPTIQYAVYERLKAVLAARARRAGRAVTSIEHFAAGAISKARNRATCAHACARAWIKASLT